ncbi:MAG: DUF3927 family protein [Pseudescherichia vulneris]|nr:DUF3927 family protein [Pseudescherichia vulneris]
MPAKTKFSGSLRWPTAAVLLFLVMSINFISKLMSVLADGVLAAGAVFLLCPLPQPTR